MGGTNAEQGGQPERRIEQVLKSLLFGGGPVTAVVQLSQVIPLKQYFAKIGEHTTGPFTIAQIKKLVETGHVIESTPISVERNKFVLAHTLPELGFKRSTVETKAFAEQRNKTSYCPSCSGMMSQYETICPNCNFDIYADRENKFRQKEEQMRPKVIDSFIDRTPGARVISQSLGLDFKLETMTFAGWGLVLFTTLTALLAVVIATRTLVDSDSPRTYIRLIAIVTTLIPGAIAFAGGRFLLWLAGVKIIKE